MAIQSTISNSAYFDSKEQVDRIVRNPIRAIHRTPGVNIAVFGPIHGSNSSFEKWSRNIEPLKTSVEESAAQERNLNCFCIEKWV